MIRRATKNGQIREISTGRETICTAAVNERNKAILRLTRSYCQVNLLPDPGQTTFQGFDRTAHSPLNSTFSLSGEFHGVRLCRRELINRTNAAAQKGTGAGREWRRKTAGLF